MAAATQSLPPEPDAQPVPERPVVPRTSVAARVRQPGEVTVQFRRYTPYGLTAYQAGQYAGFLRPQAEALVASGHAVIIALDEPATATGKRMVTK